VFNTDVSPIGQFTRDADWQAHPESMLARVQASTAEVVSLEATRLATALMGDAVATNVFVLGFAWQKGWIPLTLAALRRAIELNGAAVPMNLAAFAWGRQAALDLPKVREAAGLSVAAVVAWPQPRPKLEAVLADRVKRLTAWQDAAYAQRYETFVREVAATEQARLGGERFSTEVAVSLYKLMAYKDEYEVARLHTEDAFLDSLKARFEGDFKLRFHMAPPLFARKDANGHLVKQSFGPWMLGVMRWMAKARRLRGTPFDVFGYTAERREERAAIPSFMQLAKRLAAELDKGKLPTAIELAKLPQTVRGYGHVKAKHADAARLTEAELLRRWVG
jgi:indolepyruvate ferredoxin oxidoreductase